jgi:hypothetical protein
VLLQNRQRSPERVPFRASTLAPKALAALQVQSSNCGAQVGGGIVPEFGDAWMAFERSLYGGALDAAASPMNEADFAEAGCRRGLDVLRYHGWNVAWREGVEIDLRFDWNADRTFGHYYFAE